MRIGLKLIELDYLISISHTHLADLR
eukprot:UN08273